MEILGVIIPIAILALLLASWAHLANHRQGLAIALFVVFSLAALFMVGAGVASAVLVDQLNDLVDEELFSTRDGLYLALMGAAVGLPLLPPVRGLFARLTPIERDSIPDMVGLSVMAGVGVMMAWTIQIGGLDGELDPATNVDLVLQALLLLLIAYFGVGGAITRDFSSVRERLGLHMPTNRQVLASFLLVIPILLVSAGASALTEWLQPDYLDQIDDIMREFTRDLTTFQGALMIGITAGIGEEVLFRGAIQPRYGLIIASLLFTLIHVQYGFSFILLGVFLTSIILGIQRQRTNTTCCIITHAAYNFTIVMAATLAT